jgi:CHAT domain-containing protein
MSAVQGDDVHVSRPICLCVVLCVAALLTGSAETAAQPGVDPFAKKIRDMQAEMYKHMGQQKYFLARRQGMKIVKALQRKRGAGHQETLTAMMTAASMFTVTGDYTTAERLYREVLQQKQRQHGRDSFEAVTAEQALAGVFWARQELDKVAAIYARVSSVYRTKFGADSDMYANTLMTQAALLQQQYMFSAAEQLMFEAEKIYRKKGGHSITQALSMMMQRGMLYGRQGDFNKARKTFRKMLAGYEKHLGKKDNQTLPAMYQTVATMYQIWGLSKEADKYLDRAEKAMRERLDELRNAKVQPNMQQANEAMINATHLQLAGLLQRRGKLDEAIAAYNELVKMYEKQYGKAGGFAASAAIYPLADIYKKKKNYKKARQLLEKLSAVYSGTLGGFSGTTPLILLSEVEREAGNFAEARRLSARVLAAAQKTYGKSHPMTANYSERMAILDLALDKAPRALALLERAYGTEKKNIALILASGTEDDNRTYLSERRHHLHVAVTLHARYMPRSQRAIELGLDTVLTRKGRLLDASAGSVGTLRKGLSKKDQELLARLSAARAELSKLVLAGAQATGGDERAYAKEIARLETQVRKLEAQVRARSAVFRAKEQPIEIVNIRRAIPADAALVELVSYKRIDPKSTDYLPKSGDRYGAYVVKRRGKIAFYDLGPTRRIDKLVDALRTELSSSKGDSYKELGKRLYNLVVKRLEPSIGKARHVLLAPDGALNLLPFAALVDGDDKFLVERYRFTYLTSGRDLARLSVVVKSKSGAMIFADPSFDDSRDPASRSKSTKGKTRGLRSRSLRSIKWQRLPGTAEEAEALVKLIDKASLFRGTRATESRLKKVDAPKILHLATHGFFLPASGDEDAESVELPGSGGPAQAFGIGAVTPTVGTGPENPLLRSGLALAGANKLASGTEDGVLTALEASGLDLWGTKLVVLSACETGVGKVAQGEGVYGLRRALVIAGAESLLMSLWQVDDDATRDLITGYYRRLERGKGRSEALRLSQLRMLRSDKYQHPFYWASFIPSGQWKPMGRR